jgi:hypothetical protein
MLHATERVDLPIAELKAAGEADLRRNLAALAAPAGLRAGRRSPTACAWRRRQAAGRRRRGRARAAGGPARLRAAARPRVDPGTEQAQVAEAPPFNRWNFAYIEIPGPLLRSTCLRCTTSRRPTRAGRRRCRPPTSRPRHAAVRVRARGVAGHFLQFLHSNRADWKLRPAVRRLCLRRRLGALRRENDVGRGPGRRQPAMHIGQLRTRCCAMRATCRRSACTPAA